MEIFGRAVGSSRLSGARDRLKIMVDYGEEDFVPGNSNWLPRSSSGAVW